MSKAIEVVERNIALWRQIPSGDVVYSRGIRLLKLASQAHTFNVDEFFVVQLGTGTIHHYSRFFDLGEDKPWLTHEEMQSAVRAKVEQELGEEYSSALNVILDKIDERRSDEAQGNLG